MEETSTMKKLGYFLLWGGFTWILFEAMMWTALCRAVVYRNIDETPSKKTYTEEDLDEVRYRLSVSYENVRPHTLLPSTMMLIGSYLIIRMLRKGVTRAPAERGSVQKVSHICLGWYLR